MAGLHQVFARFAARLAAAAGLCLVWCAAPAGAQTLVPLRITGDPETRINYVILADGFTEAELDEFAGHAEEFMNLLLGSSPYVRYADFFNVYRIDIASNESGVSTPGNPVDTALGSELGCFNIGRLLCANGSLAQAALDAAAPDLRADIRLIVVNSDTYGGGGGYWATTTVNQFSGEVFEHEIGHSFALLDDEYVDANLCGNPGYGLPGEINATQEMTRENAPWRDWIEAETAVPTTGTAPGVPGLYEGAHYCAENYYRPTDNSLMRSLNRPMEQINSEQFVRRFHVTAGADDAIAPAGDFTLWRDQIARLAVIAKTIDGATLDIVWRVDGVEVAGLDSAAGFSADDAIFRFNASRWGPGEHTVTATIADETALVRTDPGMLTQRERSWTITVLDAAAPGARLNAAVAPYARSVEVGEMATAFASVINSGVETAENCQLFLRDGSGGDAPVSAFSYRATDPATNTPEGPDDPVFDIAPGATATFVFSARFDSEATGEEGFVETVCDADVQSAPAAGVNSAILSASSTPSPDIVSIAASATPGVLSAPSDGRRGAAALAAVNIGAAGDVVLSASSGAASLPVEAMVCETDPTSGACITDRMIDLPVSFAADETRTFAVFVRAYGPVPNFPERFRLFLLFEDEDGGRRGGANIALRTEE